MTQKQKIWITLGFIAIAILGYYAGKTQLFGLMKNNTPVGGATNQSGQRVTVSEAEKAFSDLINS